ncbi:MAG: right-handed parallel beta-helix repeat-containing protein, partial [Oceanipulchritudo sp.]
QNVRHITVEDCLFRRNKIDGFSNGSFGDARWTLRNCVFHDNGVSGFTGGGNHLLAENLDIHGNGRLAYLSNYTGWANEGMKVALMRNSSLRNWRVWDNWGVGIWLDTGIHKTEVAEMLVWNNRSSGIFIENNNPHNIPGLGLTPTVILRDSVFFNNSAQGTSLLGRGVALAESENVIIDNLVVVDNDTQIAVANNVRGENFNTVIANSLVGAALPRLNGLFLPRNGLGDWQDLFDTLDAHTNDNVYVMDLAAAFTGRNGEPISFSDWQQAQFNNPFNTSADKAVDSRSLFVQAPYDGRPMVNVFPLADAVMEGDADAPVFLVTRLGPDISAPQVLDLQFTAGPGYFDPADAGQVDASFPASVTIPAGELSVQMALSPSADGTVEGRQLLEATIAPSGTAYTSQATARVVVLDADVPAGANEVYLEPVATLREGGEPVTVTAVRLGELGEPLNIGLGYAGTAVAGTDYEAPPASLTFPAGAESASFTLVAIDDAQAQPTRSLVVRIAPDVGQSYIPVPPAEVPVRLEDNDTAVLEPLARVAAAGESGIVVPLQLTNPTGAAATFSLRWPDGEWLVVDSHQDDGVAYAWVDNSRPANRVSFNWNALNDDGYTIPLALGFEVNYYDQSFDSVSVNSNGFFTFGPLENFTRRYSIVLELPNSSLNTAANMVAPFWDDFSHATGGAYLSKDARQAVLTWDGVTRSGGRSMTFQTIVNRSGVLKFQYRDVNVFPTPSAGIQNGDRTKGLSLAFGEAYAEPGLAVALVPNHAWIGLPAFPLTLAAGESRTVNMRLSAAGLEPARYIQQLEIVPDSPDLSTQRLPVEIGVSGDWIVPGAGWMYLDWLGWIYSYPEGWLYHLSHGYLYGIPGSADAIYLYDPAQGWLWTSRSVYPFVYDYAAGIWRTYP